MSIDREDYQQLLLDSKYESVWNKIEPLIPSELKNSNLLRQYCGARFLVARGFTEEAKKAFEYLDSLDGSERFQDRYEVILDMINETIKGIVH